MNLPSSRPMVLSLFMSIKGHHVAAWRHPRSPAGTDLDIGLYKHQAQEAERHCYDMVFLADTLHLADYVTGRRYPGGMIDPVLLLVALSEATSRIGLGVTISTTYSAPFTVARTMASLDHISGGRAAWNVVTSVSDREARNFGLERHLGRDERYLRAREFIEVVRKLWDSWQDGALVADKASGLAFDPAGIEPIDHRGHFFNVAGPAVTARPPQGHPVLVQAGSSPAGQAFAASTADVVFTVQNKLNEAQDFYRKLKDQVAGSGRDPDQLTVLPGLSPIVGRTEEEAKAKHRELQDLIDPGLGLTMLSTLLGDVDLTGIDIDKPLPDFKESASMLSRAALVEKIGGEERLTVRELYTRIASARGHLTVIGSAEQVADAMVEWFNGRACDGFNVLPALSPEGFSDFNERVLPILREKGLARDGYTGNTLREHLGLRRPAAIQRDKRERRLAAMGRTTALEN